MVKNPKKRSKLLRILSFMCSLILLFGVIITPTLAATVSPDDDLTSYQVGVPGAYFTMTFGDRVVSANVNEVFSSYIINSVGVNGSDFVYSTSTGIDSMDLDLNCSVLEGGKYDYFVIRVRNLVTSDYFDYNDMVVDFYQGDYTYYTTNGNFTTLEPLFYTSFPGGVDVSVEGTYIGGEVVKLGDNDDTYFIYSFQPETVSLSKEYSNFSHGSISAVDFSSVPSASLDYLDPDSLSRAIYCSEYHARFDFDTTVSTSFAFYLPIIPVDSISDLRGGEPSPSFYGSTFWRSVTGVYSELRVVEVIPDLASFFDGFTGIFRIEIYEFPNGLHLTLGTLIAVPIAILIGLAIMRKFAGG